MTQVRNKNSGTVIVSLVLLIVVIIAVLSIARHFWVDSANEHFNGLISVYITEKEDLGENDRDELRSRLLEDGLFIKMHRWDKNSFIKDKELYDQMIIVRDQRQMKKEEAEGTVIETMINL